MEQSFPDLDDWDMDTEVGHVLSRALFLCTSHTGMLQLAFYGEVLLVVLGDISSAVARV